MTAKDGSTNTCLFARVFRFPVEISISNAYGALTVAFSEFFGSLLGSPSTSKGLRRVLACATINVNVRPRAHPRTKIPI